MRISPTPGNKMLLTALLCCVLLLAAGCSVRSISNSGYDSGYRSDNPMYRGELTEFDVLGIDPGKEITEEEIAKSLESSKKVRIGKGDGVMLVQSGAAFPDDPMLKEFDQHFAVMPFSGIPMNTEYASRKEGGYYGKALRLAAAKGGKEIIVCYWGVLESATKNYATKAVSWVPVVGWALPDESQHMRIRLKFALIDVKTGSWTLFAPDPLDDTAFSAMLNRESSDQEQVALLKEKAYKEAVEKLVRVYAD